MPKPHPVVVSEVCSECGQPWPDHGDDPTLRTCIDLLKRQLAKAPRFTITNSQPYATGGIIASNSTPYLVGERGPETIIPATWITKPDEDDPPLCSVG